jgi:hypothetical protein
MAPPFGIANVAFFFSNPKKDFRFYSVFFFIYNLSKAIFLISRKMQEKIFLFYVKE